MQRTEVPCEPVVARHAGGVGGPCRRFLRVVLGYGVLRVERVDVEAGTRDVVSVVEGSGSVSYDGAAVARAAAAAPRLLVVWLHDPACLYEKMHPADLGIPADAVARVAVVVFSPLQAWHARRHLRRAYATAARRAFVDDEDAARAWLTA